MRPVPGGRDLAPSSGALTRALLAAGAEPDQVQTAYERHRAGGESFSHELSLLGIDVERVVIPQGSESLPPQLGDYELGAQLGAGGMGAVYRARHLPTGSERALKVVRTDAEPEIVARFQREAEGMAAVSNPHVVRIHAAGRSGPWLWIALDLIEGGNLAELLRRGPLSFEDSRRVLRGVAAGVSSAHEVGVLHRDLKPENVLLDATGEARLVDFGLARLTWQDSLTQTGVLLGTPAYMAPEQTRGEEVDERADVYGLGGVLFHCLCGVPPFKGASLLGLLDAVLTLPAPRVSELRPDVPPDLEALCASALAKDPSERPATAQAFLDALEGRLDLRQGPRGLAPWVGLASLLLLAALGAVNLVKGPEPTPSSTQATGESLDSLLARAYAGERVDAEDRAELERALLETSASDERRRRLELGLVLLRLEAGVEPLAGVRSLGAKERTLARAVQRLQRPGSWRAQTLIEVRGLAKELAVSAWVPRWEARARVGECASLFSRREAQQAAAVLRELIGAQEGESEFESGRLSAARVALAATPKLLAELEGALDQAALRALEEGCVWAEGGASRSQSEKAPAAIRRVWRIGASAWRLECLLGRPPRLPNLVAVLADPDQVGRLYLPTKEHRQLQFEFFAPRGGGRTVVSRGLNPQVSLALKQAPATHASGLAALLSDQLVRADQDQLLRRREELLARTRSRAGEASIVHENLGLSNLYRATEGEPDEVHFLNLAREHFQLARRDGHPSMSYVVYQLAVVSMRLRDPSAAQAAFLKFHDLSRINSDGDDPWYRRRVFVLTDCATLLARTALDAPAFSERAELAAEAGRRYLRLPPPGPGSRAKRARSWHDGTQVLRAGLALWLAKDPEAKSALQRALLDHRTPNVSKQDLRNLLAGKGSVGAAWGMLRNELEAATPPYSE